MHTDTDWAGDCATRKSTSCAIVMWGDCVLHVHCRRQSVYGLSSPEAEYYGCSGVAAGSTVVAGADMGKRPGAGSSF